jgi:hypothetical protein
MVKRYLIFLTIILSVIVSVLFIIFLLKNPKGEEVQVKYPTEPLLFTTLGKTALQVDLKEIYYFEEGNVPLLFVNQEEKASQVGDIVSMLAPKLGLQVTDFQYKWSSEQGRFFFSFDNEVLLFEVSNSIDFPEGEKVFEIFFKEFLGREYEFIITNKLTSSDGETTYYYASRLIDGIPVELGFGYEYSDTLIFDASGKLKGGSILLADFIKKDIFIPLVSQEDLLEFVNVEGYPRESSVDLSSLESSLNIDFYTSGIDWSEVIESASNCVADSSMLIYLFKGIAQEYVFPIYKVYARCDIYYEGEKYSVPTDFFLNAVDLDYITVE